MNEITDAAVLVPIATSETDSTTRLGFVQRSLESSTHAGHVGFPGGKIEPEDGSLRDTALRETVEELALTAADVELLDPLEPHHTRSGNFSVTPYLGSIRAEERFDPASRGVTETFWVAESTLRDAYRMDGDRIRYPLDNGWEIWGVTA